MVKRFDELPINKEILQALKEAGHQEMFQIQAEVIPMLMRGHDVMGQAQTGTGKTAAFAIPILMKIDPKLRGIQALVLEPTRELAQQVAQEINKLGRYTSLRAVAIYGGESIERQIAELSRGRQIVVGTPGRIMDHMERGTISLGGVKVAVLDEADRMLDMGFVDDIRFILRHVPKEGRQTALLSATLPHEIKALAQHYMRSPQVVTIAPKVIHDQYFCDVREENKLAVLMKILDTWKIRKALIFSSTKRGADFVTRRLRYERYEVLALHGDMTQSQRNKAMEEFKHGRLRLLVATDVAARGIDISDVSHVINYDVPRDAETYIHRIGRSGRALQSGTAVTLVGHRDHLTFRKIMDYTHGALKRATI